MELFGVLAEVDGAGIPLAYLFMETVQAENGSTTAKHDAIANVLAQFLGVLRTTGYRPEFFGCDKDRNEISAIRRTFLEAKLQLCYWHAIQSVTRKLNANAHISINSAYHPGEAALVVPGLEICWGSVPASRPDGRHKRGDCQCSVRTDPLSDNGGPEAFTESEKDTLLDMFTRHFNSHPLIPDVNGTYRDPSIVYRECTRELYELYQARGWQKTWAYFYVFWYAPEQWKLWARTANPIEIPVSKTTMIVESHWRCLKHDFLHDHNRPRVWILTKRVFPRYAQRMDAILRNDHRVGRVSWRKKFKSEYLSLFSAFVDPASLLKYHTDPIRFVCGCETILWSRFLICKHLVYCFKPITKRVVFFDTVKRQRSYPFWSSDLLVLKDEFANGIGLSIDSSSRLLQPASRYAPGYSGGFDGDDGVEGHNDDEEDVSEADASDPGRHPPKSLAQQQLQLPPGSLRDLRRRPCCPGA